ncbi:AbrB/MazE/SpoVT family DNA-binding domain-containing protein [Bdellovibrio bacteriovorus]|uniref:AbrB/MazE/SpoVT family DNA-binding domain-containing protein n=1 Tax=Bdellovibrio bacteriovorus TaxID=959 RepID=UPI0035A592B6
MSKSGATSKASRKNQTTIPARVRQALGIAKGDTLLWTVNGNEVSIRIINRKQVDWSKTSELSLLEWTQETEKTTEPEASV